MSQGNAASAENVVTVNVPAASLNWRQCYVSAVSNAAYIQYVKVTLNYSDGTPSKTAGTFSGSGEGDVSLAWSEGGYALVVSEVEAANLVSLTFEFSDSSGSMPKVYNSISPDDTTDAHISHYEYRTEDAVDNDNNDTILTLLFTRVS